MSEIQRYEFCTYDGYEHAEMLTAEKAEAPGRWVLYTDHLAALAAAAEREKVWREWMKHKEDLIIDEFDESGKCVTCEKFRAALALVKEPKP